MIFRILSLHAGSERSHGKALDKTWMYVVERERSLTYWESCAGSQGCSEDKLNRILLCCLELQKHKHRPKPSSELTSHRWFIPSIWCYLHNNYVSEKVEMQPNVQWDASKDFLTRVFKILVSFPLTAKSEKVQLILMWLWFLVQNCTVFLSVFSQTSILYLIFVI